MGKERLQKVMAHAGIASRRKSEDFIRQGRVTVNGQVAELGCKVDLAEDYVEVDGEPLEGREKRVYLILNKPDGYITTVSDPQGRPTVVDLVSNVEQRVYPVGRLDYDTTGLLLLTNDGELTHRLLHPSYESDKTYLVTVAGLPGQETLKALRQGVQLEDGMTAPAQAEVVDQAGKQTTLRLTIHEGRNRQIRRMMRAVGHEVASLERVSFGPLNLDSLERGSWRFLSQKEVQQLRDYVGLS